MGWPVCNPHGSNVLPMASTDTAAAGGMPGSRLIASLAQRDIDHLRNDLERVRLDPERTLIHAHAPARRVFFPESGLVALSVTMADGRTAGVTIVGSEGIVGLSAALGETGVMDAAVLVPGVAQTMSAERFRAAMRTELRGGSAKALRRARAQKNRRGID